MARALTVLAVVILFQACALFAFVRLEGRLGFGAGILIGSVGLIVAATIFFRLAVKDGLRPAD